MQARAVGHIIPHAGVSASPKSVSTVMQRKKHFRPAYTAKVLCVGVRPVLALWSPYKIWFSMSYHVAVCWGNKNWRALVSHSLQFRSYVQSQKHASSLDVSLYTKFDHSGQGCGRR